MILNNNENKVNVRKLSFNILYEVFFKKKLLNEEMNIQLCKYSDLNDKDKNYIKKEVTSIIENLNDVDLVISKYSKYEISKLNKDILILLRIGVFELLYMDRVPSFATINELVNIIKKTKSNRFASFLNAVLRNIDRGKVELIDNIKNTKNTEKKCYFRIYNDREIDVINELNKKNIKYKKYEGSLDFKYAKVYQVEKYKDIIELDVFKDGGILIEDASSIYMTDVLADFIKTREKLIKQNNNCDTISMMKLLDTCASPGGKILGLIDFIYNDYVYFYAEARDISKAKILKICENINRLKVMDLNLNVKDASVYDALEYEKYDVVMCDVPCTGLGVIDKKPDILLNYSEDKRNELVKIQTKIINTSKNYVKKGGILTYSTCTETLEENENITNAFVKENFDFKKIFEKRINRNDSANSDGFYMCFFEKV